MDTLISLISKQYSINSSEANDTANSLIKDVMDGDSEMSKQEAINCLIEDFEINGRI